VLADSVGPFDFFDIAARLSPLTARELRRATIENGGHCSIDCWPSPLTLNRCRRRRPASEPGALQIKKKKMDNGILRALQFRYLLLPFFVREFSFKKSY
jgi:hypothetical protein